MLKGSFTLEIQRDGNSTKELKRNAGQSFKSPVPEMKNAYDGIISVGWTGLRKGSRTLRT